MDWFLKSLNAAGDGGLDLSAACAADELWVALITGATPDVSDAGHEFMQDLLDDGATVETEFQITGASYADRIAALAQAEDFTIPDPGGGSAATWAVLYRKTGSNATARLFGAEDIQDLTFDGENDTMENVGPELLRIGPS